MILIDTNVLVALYNTRDTTHERAVDLMNRIYEGEFGPPFITDYVFNEATTIAKSKTGSIARDFGNALLKSFNIARISEPVFHGAWRLFIKPNKLSFTDCTNLIAAKNAKAAIATFDKEFRKQNMVPIIH